MNSSEILFYLVCLSPIIIGGIIALVNSDGVNNATEKFELWIRKQHNNTTQSNSRVSRYLTRPILWLFVKFSNWTDSFVHRGLKNGARVAMSIFLVAFWLFIAFMAIQIVIGIIMLYFIFLMIMAFSGYEYKNTSSAKVRVGERGKETYSGSNWFNEEKTGRVDEEGNIYEGDNWFNEKKVGRIDEEGNVLEGDNWFNERKTGRIDKKGNVHEGDNWFNEKKVGRIDKEGNVHEGDNWFNEKKKGKLK